MSFSFIRFSFTLSDCDIALIHPLYGNSSFGWPLYFKHSLYWWPIWAQQKQKSGRFSYSTGIRILAPFICTNTTFFKGCVTFMEILTRVNWPIHSPTSSVSISYTLPIFFPTSIITSLFMHMMHKLWICTQNDMYMKDCFFVLPIPLGSDNTISARSKCHGPRIKVLFFSSSEPNLNKNIFSPMLSTFTSLTVLYTCWIVIFKLSYWLPSCVKFFPPNNLQQFSLF